MANRTFILSAKLSTECWTQPTSRMKVVWRTLTTHPLKESSFRAAAWVLRGDMWRGITSLFFAPIQIIFFGSLTDIALCPCQIWSGIRLRIYITYIVVEANHYVSRFIIVYQIFEPKSWINAEAIISNYLLSYYYDIFTIGSLFFA